MFLGLRRVATFFGERGRVFVDAAKIKTKRVGGGKLLILEMLLPLCLFDVQDKVEVVKIKFLHLKQNS